jgi:hypothetical protein
MNRQRLQTEVEKLTCMTVKRRFMIAFNNSAITNTYWHQTHS